MEVTDAKYLSYGGANTHDFYSWLRYPNRTHEENYLKYFKRERKQVNILLKLYRERARNIKYVQAAMNFYDAAWQEDFPILAFLCFCIVLEGIVHGKEQVTFRFRRNLAVLLGQNRSSSKTILENAKKLYDMRSSIVHSSIDNKLFKNFELYFEYSKALSSRMIIEMILHRVETLKELDDKLVELGFGDRKKISDNYQPIIGNPKSLKKILEALPPI